MLTADRPTTTTTTHLSRLEDSGLIRLAQLEPEVEYLFRHGLVQDAVYESLLRQDRRKLHRAVGEALERAYPDRLDALAGVLAAHFAESGEADRALDYYRRAGDHAYAQYALAEAIGFYGSALDIGMKLDAPPVDALRHMALRKGRAYELQGDYPNALQTYERMQALAEEASDQAALLDALMAQSVIRATPSTVYDGEKGIILAEQAMQIAQQIGNQAAEARLLWILSLANAYGRAEVGYGLELGYRSVALSRELGLTEQLAYTLTDMSNMFLTGGRFVEGAEMLDEATPLWRSLNNLPMLAFALNLRGQLESYRGDLKAALPAAQEALEICKAINNLEGAAFSYSVVSAVTGYFGNPSRALANLEEMFQMMQQVDFVIPMAGMGHTVKLWMLTELGALDQGRQALQRYYELHPLASLSGAILATTLIELARIELALGQAGGAVHALMNAYNSGVYDAGGIDTMMWAGMVESEHSVMEGDLEAALNSIEATIEAFDRTGARREMPDALLLKSKILVGLKREAEAFDPLNTALIEAHKVGNRLIEWRILSVLADLEAKHGRAESAVQHRREGLAVLEAIAATLIDRPDLRASLLARPEAVSLTQS